jgi:hypothetical protein
MKKYFQYSLLSLCAVTALCATGVAIWSWTVDQERIRSVEEWNRSIDPFVNFFTKRKHLTTEAQILTKLLRQNPNHLLWKEYEFEAIFKSDPMYWLSQNISWPHQTIELGQEQIQILRSSNICNRRLIFVYTDAAAKILEVKVVPGKNFFASHTFQVKTESPQPVITLVSTDLNDSLALPIVQELDFSKSSFHKIVPDRVKITDNR